MSIYFKEVADEVSLARYNIVLSAYIENIEKFWQSSLFIEMDEG